MADVSKDEFYSRFSSMKLGELKAIAAAQGHALTAASRSDAVDELWALYTGKIGAPAAPVAAPVGDVCWEARLVDSRRPQYKRAGYSFTRRWEELKPQPDADQLSILKADPALQVRLKG